MIAGQIAFTKSNERESILTGRGNLLQREVFLDREQLQ
jgi:hypothetical protein